MDKEAEIRRWDGVEILDILRYHVSPSLWYITDSRSCRLVCRSWSVAFPLWRVQIRPSTLESKSDVLTKVMASVSTVSIKGGEESCLDWVCGAVAENLNLRALLVQKLASLAAAEKVCQILRLNLPLLRDLELGIPSGSEISGDQISDVLSGALAETRSPIAELEISNLKSLKLLDAALPKTLKWLHVGTRVSDNLEPLLQFIKRNQAVTWLNISLFFGRSVDHGEGAPVPQRLADAFAADTTVTTLELGGTEWKAAHELFAALRTNRNLRRLLLRWIPIKAQHLSSVVDCLCQNDTLTSLSFSLNTLDEKVGPALCRLFELNRSLKKLRVDMDSPVDLSSMFAGLAKNSTLRKLCMSHVDSHFIEQLSDCIISTHGTEFARLERIEISYTSMDETAASKLADAVAGLTNLRILDLFVIEAGPSCAESFARMIETSKSLEMLGLYGCKPGDEGLIRICEAVKKSASLVEIALGGEAHSESAVLAVHDMISTYKRLEFLDFSGTDIPLRFKQLFSDAVLQNPNMYRCEVCFRPDENSPEGDSESLDLKHELTKQYW
eukprot:TRINITY_DN2626_c0_g1_i1.p1 TRINITY_DN2626_c0_g1~~TRINITY_DN2626_c0_g1_i1.p1  ORF type:complete len:555 (-),score=76.58 TRINITY_DN2626_c0_g1_i1:95-1759(-)